jgi:hypothetical protein
MQALSYVLWVFKSKLYKKMENPAGHLGVYFYISFPDPDQKKYKKIL